MKHVSNRFPRVSLSFSLFTFVMLAMLLPPKEASADWLGFWLKAKTDYIGGSNEIFNDFNGMGGGVEAGIEILNISIWADYVHMSEGRYWASGNLGFDLKFGSDWEFMMGMYVGGFLMGLAESQGESGELNANQKNQLESEFGMVPGFDLMSFEQGYAEASSNESQFLDKAGGITGRLRLSFARKLLPLLYMGIQTTVGYHYVLSGLEASSEAKDKYISDQGDLTTEQADTLKDILEINENKSTDPSGLNYSFGLFLNLAF